MCGGCSQAVHLLSRRSGLKEIRDLRFEISDLPEKSRLPICLWCDILLKLSAQVNRLQNLSLLFFCCELFVYQTASILRPSGRDGEGCLITQTDSLRCIARKRQDVVQYHICTYKVGAIALCFGGGYSDFVWASSLKTSTGACRYQGWRNATLGRLNHS